MRAVAERHPWPASRRSGYTSSTSRTNGSETSIDLEEQPQREERDRAEVPAAPSCAAGRHGLQIREHCEQIEQRGEHVAPFGDPRHRLGAQRVQREERGRGGGAETPGRVAGRGQRRGEQPPGDDEEDGDVARVEQEVAEVVAERVHAPQHVIQAEG